LSDKQGRYILNAPFSLLNFLTERTGFSVKKLRRENGALRMWRNGQSQPSLKELPMANNHPHFNDQGAVAWHTRLADALAEAQATNKHVFIEFGRFM
jgi:hypothetical protein